MPVIGLNIGKKSFKAVELDFKKDKIIVNNFGSIVNPKISTDPATADDVKTMSASLSQFFSEIGFSTSDVIVSLDETHVFMRIIKLPLMNDKELKSSIKFEAEQYIPLPIDQVTLSYQKLEQDFTEKGKISVQIVAARKDMVDKYVDILRGAKLVPKAIEPETIALGRVLGDTKEAPSGTMILEMGYATTLIIICYGGFVRFTRTIPVGGDALTKAIMQGLSLERDQAEEYKKAYGLDEFQGDGKVAESIRPIIDNLVMEVQRASVFFTNHNPSANIRRVILSGGTALMPSLLSYVAEKLDLEVMLANPLNNIEISPKIEKQKQQLIDEAASYASAIGLALRK